MIAWMDFLMDGRIYWLMTANWLTLDTFVQLCNVICVWESQQFPLPFDLGLLYNMLLPDRSSLMLAQLPVPTLSMHGEDLSFLTVGSFYLFLIWMHSRRLYHLLLSHYVSNWHCSQYIERLIALSHWLTKKAVKNTVSIYLVCWTKHYENSNLSQVNTFLTACDITSGWFDSWNAALWICVSLQIFSGRISDLNW